VEAIRDWPVPKSIHDVRGFHKLASFYKRFIKNFSTVMTPMTKLIKRNSFQWNPKSQQAFKEVKGKLTQATVLAVPSFEKYLRLKVMPQG